MNLSHDLELLADMQKLIERLAAGVGELHRRARIPVAGDGFPTHSAGAQSSSSSPASEPVSIDYADPTGQAAMSRGRHSDPVGDRRRRLSHEVERAAKALKAAAAQLVDPAHLDASGPWCSSCYRIKHTEDDRPYLSPPDTRVKGSTNVGGRLAQPMVLCRRCRDWVQVTGMLPPRKQLTAYLLTGRMPRVKV